MTETRVTYKTLNAAIEATRKEIKADIKDVRKDISDLADRIEKTFVTQKEFCPVRDDVRDLEANQRWVVITVVGTVLVAILAMIIRPQLM
jgi:plasmid maintenance system antidote protein VapI